MHQLVPDFLELRTETVVRGVATSSMLLLSLSRHHWMLILIVISGASQQDALPATAREKSRAEAIGWHGIVTQLERDKNWERQQGITSDGPEAVNRHRETKTETETGTEAKAKTVRPTQLAGPDTGPVVSTNERLTWKTFSKVHVVSRVVAFAPRSDTGASRPDVCPTGSSFPVAVVRASPWRADPH